MSELISGKEALIALANGDAVDYRVKNGTWVLVNGDWKIREFDQGHYEFRLKPRTVNLNGVDVGLLYSSQWDKQNPNKVTIEFNTEEEARHFNNNALKIFNGV